VLAQRLFECRAGLLQKASPAFFAQPIAVTADGDDLAVVEQAVEDRGGDDELRKQSLAEPTRLGPREKAKRFPLMFEAQCLAKMEMRPHLLSADHTSLIRPRRLPYGVSVDALVPAPAWE
jgi:hypothetical protein